MCSTLGMVGNKEEKNIADAKVIKEKLEKIILEFGVSANNGKVFGSVSTKQISEELKKHDFNIDKKLIVIDSPLSSLGVHVVLINLHKKVKAELKVKLVQK